MQLFMITSWAPWRWSKACCANASTPGRLVGGNVIAIWGMCPYISPKGAYPIDLFALEFSANSVMGNWSTQSHWSGHLYDLDDCLNHPFGLSIPLGVEGSGHF